MEKTPVVNFAFRHQGSNTVLFVKTVPYENKEAAKKDYTRAAQLLGLEFNVYCIGGTIS